MTAVTAAVVSPLASARRPALTGPSRSMTSRQRPSVRLMPSARHAASSIWSTADLRGADLERQRVDELVLGLS